MTFYAHVSGGTSTGFSFEGRDKNKGILGKLDSASTPVAEGHNLDDVRQKARAYLIQHPSAGLYLVDSDKMVHEIVFDKEHHKAKSRTGRRKIMAAAFLVFGVTSVSCVAARVMVLEALWMFAGASALYLVIIKTKVCNEIEGALLTEMLLLLALVLVPILRHMNHN